VLKPCPRDSRSVYGQSLGPISRSGSVRSAIAALQAIPTKLIDVQADWHTPNQLPVSNKRLANLYSRLARVAREPCLNLSAAQGLVRAGTGRCRARFLPRPGGSMQQLPAARDFSPIAGIRGIACRRGRRIRFSAQQFAGTGSEGLPYPIAVAGSIFTKSVAPGRPKPGPNSIPMQRSL